jgi:hypothetical protein
MKKSFCFVLNPLEVTGQVPVELIPGHFLQKADVEQTKLIREQLHRHYARHYPFPAYEYEWLEEVKDDKGGSSRGSRELPTDRFRYWIVSFDGANTHTDGLQLAVNLLKNDLDFGFHFMYRKDGEGAGIISGHSNVSSYFESHPKMFGNCGNGADTIDTVELIETNGYFQSIKACEKEQPLIYKSIRDFFQLKSLPRNSSMVILGYFAVIESLVTHDPKDDFDSLNHQISTKMTLLSKRFKRQMDYNGHFEQPDQERVWKKLYGYRSALAHGTPADFKLKFKSLKDPSNALNFLKEAAKLTLLFAMKEPDFLADFKKC